MLLVGCQTGANKPSASGRLAQSEKNEQEGAAFQARNKQQDGVKTLPSGLQYQVLKQGSGRTPGPADTVTAHYRGTLLDGTEFDSSYLHGQPIDFPVRGVIPGWTEALQRMHVGDKWKLVIPAPLAYGDNPPPGSGIPPGSTLVFEIELLAVNGGGQ